MGYRAKHDPRKAVFILVYQETIKFRVISQKFNNSY